MIIVSVSPDLNVISQLVLFWKQVFIKHSPLPTAQSNNPITSFTCPTTSVKKEEQVIILLLESLDCNAKAEKAVSELTANELNTNDGIDIVIRKLDSISQSKTIDEAYSTYLNFINYKRNDDEDISDYIIEYDHYMDIIYQFMFTLTISCLLMA